MKEFGNDFKVKITDMHIKIPYETIVLKGNYELSCKKTVERQGHFSRTIWYSDIWIKDSQDKNIYIGINFQPASQITQADHEALFLKVGDKDNEFIVIHLQTGKYQIIE